MEILEIDRITVATPDLEKLERSLTDLLGIEFGDQLNTVTETDAGRSDLAIKFSELGIELMTTRTDDGPVARFIEENGTNMYAISIRVADLAEARAELAAKGVEPIGEFTSDSCAELFYHPRHFDGLFLFFTEYTAGHPAERALAEFAEE